MALSANRLVCSAIDVITSITFPICAELSPSFATFSLVTSTERTASAATFEASEDEVAISRTDADISSTAVATVCTL